MTKNTDITLSIATTADIVAELCRRPNLDFLLVLPYLQDGQTTLQIVIGHVPDRIAGGLLELASAMVREACE